MLENMNITTEVTPARRHNKNGKIERKHRTLRMFMRKLQMDTPSASIQRLTNTAGFYSNLFYGSRTTSSFELARGYTPRLLGDGSQQRLPTALREAYISTKANRLLTRI